MIILKKIKIENFLSHKDTEIEFPENNNLLIDGKSGSGKSSIVEAVIWCLYGEARVSNKDLVKHGEETSSVVLELYNEGSDKLYTISRSTTDKGKNSLDITMTMDDGPVPISRNGLKDKQDWIEKDFLNCSHTLFVNSIAYTQENTESFVKQTAPKRKDLLLEIANIDSFDMYYKNASNKLSETLGEKLGVLSRNQAYSDQIEAQKNLIEDENELDKLISHRDILIENHHGAVNNLNSQIKEIEDNNDDLEKIRIQYRTESQEMNKLSDRELTKKSEINKIEHIDIQSMKDNVIKYEILKNKIESFYEKTRKDYERINKLNALMSDMPNNRDYEGEIEEINIRLSVLLKETTKCPSGDSCPYVIPIKNQIDHLIRQIEEKKESKRQLDKEKSIYSQKITDLGLPIMSSEGINEYNNIKNEIIQYTGAEILLSNAKTQIERLPLLKKEYDDIMNLLGIFSKKVDETGRKLRELSFFKNENEDNLTSLKESARLEKQKIITISKEKDALLTRKVTSANARQSIKNLEKEIEETQEKLKGIEDKIEILLITKEAFGSKGLKTIVIDYLIPRLEEKINEILSQLSDFKVRLDTQKSSSDGEGTIEGLFINIYNERGEQFDFSSYSGGERLKITVAISEALASIQKCGFRIFDELFIGLDEESTDHFAGVMDTLQHKFKQIICISHLRNIKDLFNDKITIIKNNGTSKIENES